jgi:hypothetical protein
MGTGHLLPALSRGLTHRGSPVRLRIATGLALAAAGALLVTVIWTAGPDPETGDAPLDVVRVGVVEGQSVPGYLTASRGELAALLRPPATTTETWALVSLSAYVVPGRLAALLGGAAVAEVYARVPLGSAETSVVRIAAYRLPGDVVAGMLGAAISRERERADYAQLGRQTTGQDPGDVRLRRAYADSAAVAEAEAAAYRDGCACVFAAVVRAAPAVLDQIAGRGPVRVVDPAPEVLSLAGTEFRAPLPEQRSTVPVETRSATPSAPSDAGMVAPPTLAPLPSSLGAAVTSASSEGPVSNSDPSVPASEERADVPSAPASSLVQRGRRPGPRELLGR